jgi:hypothetical protein
VCDRELIRFRSRQKASLLVMGVSKAIDQALQQYMKEYLTV